MPTKKTKNEEANDISQTILDTAKKLALVTKEDREILKALQGNWDKTKTDVDVLDKEFKDMENNPIDVRVMQVGPGGVLTDVSDKINPRDLRADQIADFRTDGATGIPLGSDGRVDREAAMDILTRIAGKRGRVAGNSSEAVMKRMEAALSESDRIISHFKD